MGDELRSFQRDVLEDERTVVDAGEGIGIAFEKYGEAYKDSASTTVGKVASKTFFAIGFALTYEHYKFKGLSPTEATVATLAQKGIATVAGVAAGETGPGAFAAAYATDQAVEKKFDDWIDHIPNTWDRSLRVPSAGTPEFAPNYSFWGDDKEEGSRSPSDDRPPAGTQNGSFNSPYAPAGALSPSYSGPAGERPDPFNSPNPADHPNATGAIPGSSPTARSGAGYLGPSGHSTPSAASFGPTTATEASTKGKSGLSPGGGSYSGGGSGGGSGAPSGSGSSNGNTGQGAGGNSAGASGSGTTRTGGGYVTRNELGERLTETNTKAGPRPIVLDLNGNGIEITELSKSTQFRDSSGDGLLHRTAWTASGDGVLFYDVGNDGLINEKREYVFTEWDPTATSDLKALRAAFDSNGDGKLSAADAAFSLFKVMVTNPDGSTVAKTLSELGITEINLEGDATEITLADGSKITAQTTFTRADGSTGTVADTVLMSEAEGHRVVQTVTVDGSGNRTVVTKVYGTDGNLVSASTSLTSSDGLSVQNSYDDNGDGVNDRLQTISTVVNGNGSRTETVVNKAGNVAAAAVLENTTVTTTSVDGKTVTIQRDTTGGGWFDEVETRIQATDGSRTNTTTQYASDGTTVIARTTETVSADGKVRSELIDSDGNSTTDTQVAQAISFAGAVRTTLMTTSNSDGSLRTRESEVIAANGRDKVISRDHDGNDSFETIENLSVTLNGDGSKTSVLDVLNTDGSKRTITSYTQSADTLTKVIAQDLDSDAAFERTTTDTTVINTDGSRLHTVVTRNVDTSVNQMTKEYLGADKVTSEVWIDRNQDGVFQATDLASSVTINSTTHERTTLSFARSADGTLISQVSQDVSEDGLTRSRTDDADGDGDTDTALSDVTVLNGDGASTESAVLSNGDGSQRSATLTTRSADGLSVLTLQDIAGSNAWDLRTQSTIVKNANGSVTTTLSERSGDNSALLSQVVTTESADRLTKTVSTDANGDGSIDLIVARVEAQDGSETVTTSLYRPDGLLQSKAISSVSANGLVRSTLTDGNGDGVFEAYETATTVLQSDGSRVTTSTVLNGDDTLRTRSILTLSDDGLSQENKVDLNGDGVIDDRTLTTRSFGTDGNTEDLTIHFAGNGATLSVRSVATSDDGLVTTDKFDADGNGTWDQQVTRETVLSDNGDTVVTSSEYDLNPSYGAVLRARSVTTISDDGRSSVTSSDIDGDGHVDQQISRTEGLSGVVTTSVTNLSSTGGMQSKTDTVQSANGLSQAQTFDYNGDGLADHSIQMVKVLNANGTSDLTESHLARNGGLIARTVTTESDDHQTISTNYDHDGNGVIDRTRTLAHVLSSDGSKSDTETLRSQTNALIFSETVATSTDGRTVSTTTDLNGDGVVDVLKVSSEAVSGIVTSTSSYYSAGGAVEVRDTETVSADGLTRIFAHDADADGWSDITRKDVTIRGEDGTVSHTLTVFDGSNSLTGQEESWTSDDGFSSWTRIDNDGDGVIDRVSQFARTINGDGSIELLETTNDGSGALRAKITSTTSGNGLLRTSSHDLDGDGGANWAETEIISTDGARTTTKTTFGPQQLVRQEAIWTVSADGRADSLSLDRDGDGEIDRTKVSTTDHDQITTETLTDFGLAGAVRSVISQTLPLNETVRTTTFDVNGDGSTDFRNTLTTEYAAEGDKVETYRESVANRIAYTSTTITEYSGLSSVTAIDNDGDGATDLTTNYTRTLAADGSETETSSTTYADGGLRAKWSTYVSPDGRISTTSFDRDGNGVVDRLVSVENTRDGQIIETETTYTKNGSVLKELITTTSADGLTTTVNRDGVLEVLQRSAVDSQSYSWDNGVKATTSSTNLHSTHTVDALGVEEWTYTTLKYKTTTLKDGTTVRQDVTSTYSAVVDAETKSQIFAEAQAVYDVALDRDMTTFEKESLVVYVTDGTLDSSKLAKDLAAVDGTASTEFNKRFGNTSDGEFIEQIYLNGLGRSPTLAELDRELRVLSQPSLGGYATNFDARAGLVVALAQSSEHILVGSEHQSTNNNDLDIAPPVFERTLDRSQAEALADRFIDVLYDRDATANERELIVKRILTGTDALDDIVSDFRGQSGNLAGVASTNLVGLTGAALVDQAFLNALGRLPTSAERAMWGDNLTSGRLTADQFVVAVAVSIDHDSVGNSHIPAIDPTATQLNGSGAADTLTAGNVRTVLDGLAGNDTLNGGTDADTLVGGLGTDALRGGAGSDSYVWTKGDGNDTLTDTSSSLVETDNLVLTNVNPTDVELTHSNGTTDLQVKVLSTGEILTVVDQFNSITRGYGVEQITFADGAVWSLSDILNKTTMLGTLGGDTLSGSNMRDVISGLEANDTLNGGDGDDKLTGGLGVDSVKGGNGSDTYVWSTGDGNDTVNDSGTSLLEIDTLVLTGVLPSGVQLIHSSGSDNLQVKVVSTGEVLTVSNQFNDPTAGYGIEKIAFSDGTSWMLSDIFASSAISGSTGVDTLSGSQFRDNLFGLAGNDTLSGGDGSDTLMGGTGVDTLKGGNGSDTYKWAQGDGSDTIDDNSASLGEIDTLVLMDVLSSDVQLSRANGTDDLQIKIVSTGEIIAVLNRYQDPSNGYGIETIRFADGITWELPDILNRTVVSGTSGADSLSGSDYRDNLYGLAGNDTLTGGNGSDVLVGGLGVDTLKGGNGGDRYIWSKGDGSDVINDGGTSLTEVDSLYLTDATSTGVVLTKSGDDLIITVSATGEAISSLSRFSSSTAGYGIEKIFYSDGVVTDILASPLGEVVTTGTAAANTLSGWQFRDQLFGLDGNDTLNSNNGDDVLNGGKGIDTLNGGNGSDNYVWLKGDGSDIINDNASRLSEIDTLVLSDTISSDVELLRSNGSDDLQIKVISTGEVITVLNRFNNPANGYGIEMISFSDGVNWTLPAILQDTRVLGTTAADNLTGTGYQDNLYGLGGNDTLSGGNGNDQLVGGTGVDSLVGGNGSDTYVWSKGDGSDTIHDNATTLTETDTLNLLDVQPADVQLTRLSGSDDLLIKILSTGEVITVLNRYNNPASGYGIEQITFTDGSVWSLSDILNKTSVLGTSANETLSGTNYDDRLFGLAGNDTLNGSNGDDTLVGGLGSDTLSGSNGADSYVWAKGDGNDTINDNGQSLVEDDSLILSDVTSTDVALLRANGTDDLQVKIVSTGEIITVLNRYNNPTNGYGIEAIQFSDGIAWSLADIIARAEMSGTSAADTLAGSNYADKIYALAGNDTVDGNNGDDVLVGGTGVDALNGGNGSDTFVWSKGDGGDTVTDAATNFSETDTLKLLDVLASDVALVHASGSNHLQVKILSTGEILTITNQFYGSWGNATGIEKIVFSDGSSWNLQDILSNTKMTGTSGNEILTGSAYQDNIDGLAGTDTLNGNDGDDVLVGGAGADTLNGGNGTDTVSYANSSAAVTVNLITNVNAGGDAQGDSLTSIENITGSSFGDTLTGSAVANVLNGGDGNDTMFGGAGDDTFITGLGADQVDGGDGALDLVHYGTSSGAVTVNLTTNVNTGGDAQGDLLTNIERIVGSAFADSLTGNAQANELYGGAGTDVINGMEGNDQLAGGNGDDVFVFSSMTFGLDTIQDFENGHDKLSFGSTGLTLADFTITQVDNDTMLTLASNTAHKIILENVLSSTIDASDVI